MASAILINPVGEVSYRLPVGHNEDQWAATPEESLNYFPAMYSADYYPGAGQGFFIGHKPDPADPTGNKLSYLEVNVGDIGGWNITSEHIEKPNAVMNSAGDPYIAFGPDGAVPTTYGNTPGVWMGWQNSVSKARVSLYADQDNYMQFDGTNMMVGGDIQAKTFTSVGGSSFDGASEFTGDVVFTTQVLFFDHSQQNLGIDTATPDAAYKLDIQGNSRFGADAVFGTNALYFDASQNSIGVGATPLGGQGLYIAASTLYEADVRMGGNTFFFDYSQANIGIGTVLPDAGYKLHILGDTRMEGNLTVNGTFTVIDTDTQTTEQIIITNDGTGPALIVNQTGAQPVAQFQDDGAPAFNILDGGIGEFLFELRAQGPGVFNDTVTFNADVTGIAMDEIENPQTPITWSMATHNLTYAFDDFVAAGVIAYEWTGIPATSDMFTLRQLTANPGPSNLAFFSAEDADVTTLHLDHVYASGVALHVDGIANFNNSVFLNTTLDVDGAVTLNTTLDVDGISSFHGHVRVDGGQSFQNIAGSYEVYGFGGPIDANFEKGVIRHDGIAWLFESDSGGTGTAGNIEFYSNNTDLWTILQTGGAVSYGDLTPNTSYAHNLGVASNRWLSIYGSELRIPMIVSEEEVATTGGRLMVGTSTTLTTDVASGDGSIVVQHNNIQSGDILRLEARGQVEFLQATNNGTGTGPYTYTVTRNYGSLTSPQNWQAGDGVFNSKQVGDSFIDMYAINAFTDVAGGTILGPTISFNERTGTGPADINTIGAVGRLDGIDTPEFGVLSGIGIYGQRGFFGSDVTIGGNGLLIPSNTVAYFSFDNNYIDQIFGREPGTSDLLSYSSGYVQGTNLAITKRATEGKFGGSLAIEPGTTNLVVDPSELTTASWSTTVFVEPITSNFGYSPFGKKTADLIEFNSSGQASVYQGGITVSINTTYTFSFYVKMRSPAATLELAVYDETNFNWIDVDVSYSATNEWTRITHTFTTPATCTSARIYPIRHDVTADMKVFITGVQLEQKQYATSYVEGARNDGLYRFPESLLPQREGSISAWIKPNYDYTALNLDYHGIVTETLSHTNDQFHFWVNSTGILQLSIRTNDEAVTYSTGYSPPSWDPTQWHHVGCTWDDNSIAIYYNGEQVSSANWAPTSRWTPTYTTIGTASDVSANDWLDGLLDDLIIVAEAKDASWFQQIYQSDGPFRKSQEQTYLSGDNIHTGEISSSNWSGIGGYVGSLVDLNRGHVYFYHTADNYFYMDDTGVHIRGALDVDDIEALGTITGLVLQTDTPPNARIAMDGDDDAFYVYEAGQANVKDGGEAAMTIGTAITGNFGTAPGFQLTGNGYIDGSLEIQNGALQFRQSGQILDALWQGEQTGTNESGLWFYTGIDADSGNNNRRAHIRQTLRADYTVDTTYEMFAMDFYGDNYWDASKRGAFLYTTAPGLYIGAGIIEPTSRGDSDFNEQANASVTITAAAMDVKGIFEVHDANNFGSAWKDGFEILSAVSNDSHVDIVSGEGGTWGSGISFKEVNTSNQSYINAWGFIRKTAAQGSDLFLTYGTHADPAANSQLFTFTNDGKIIMENHGQIEYNETTKTLDFSIT